MTGSLMCIVPFTCTGGIPCEVPGFNPTSPLITVGPVLVVEAVAIMAKLPADPRLMVAGPEAATAPVVKLHGFGAAPTANALPDRSLTRFEIAAVYFVLLARLVDGLKV